MCDTSINKNCKDALKGCLCTENDFKLCGEETKKQCSCFILYPHQIMMSKMNLAWDSGLHYCTDIPNFHKSLPETECRPEDWVGMKETGLIHCLNKFPMLSKTC